MSFCVLDANCSVYDRAAQLPGYTHSNPLCEGCRRRSESELNLLRYDYVDLSQLIPRQDGRSDAKISRPKPESVPPIAVGVFTVRGEIAWIAAVATKVLRRFLHDHARPSLPVREGFALDQDVRYLTTRVDELATLPATEAPWRQEGEPVVLDGPQVLLRFAELHRIARRICGLAAKTITVPGHCPNCEVPSLRRADDNPEKVWCQHCRLSMTEHEYLSAQRMQFAHPGEWRPAP